MMQDSIGLQGKQRLYLLLSLLIVSIAIPFLAIDRRSFWIDEFVTWLITQQPDLDSWWSAFLQRRDSDGQLPFFHFFMFLWTSLFGTSEWTMRMANAPWFALGCAAIALAPVTYRIRLIWHATIAMHPYIWYYLNESRSYVLLFAG